MATVDAEKKLQNRVLHWLVDDLGYKEIVSLNGLKSNVIYSGMKLKIPNK